MDEILKKRLKVIGVFGVVFLLLAAWTIKLSINKQQETELVMAVMAEPVGQYFIEEYQPYTASEMTELIERINATAIENGSIVVITRKPTFYQFVVAAVDEDYSNIWAPDCYELRKLILQHDLTLQTYEPKAGKMVHVMIDNGKVWNKPTDAVAKQFKSEEVMAQCGQLRHRSFGHASGSHMNGGY